LRTQTWYLAELSAVHCALTCYLYDGKMLSYCVCAWWKMWANSYPQCAKCA